jgi:NADPH:quinone reductase
MGPGCDRVSSRPSVRAAVVTRFGGPEVLEVRDEPEPETGPGDLLVAPEAIGVNYRDIYEREGRYGGEAPLVAGVEGAGVVVAGPSEGERVAWLAAPGSYAERVVVPAEKAVPIPEGVSSELAAAVLLQGVTAQ